MRNEPDNPDRKRPGSLLTHLWAVVLLLSAYIGAYYLTATPVLVAITFPAGNIGAENHCVYTFHNWSIPDAIFWPAHQLDRCLRPEIWREASP